MFLHFWNMIVTGPKILHNRCSFFKTHRLTSTQPRDYRVVFLYINRPGVQKHPGQPDWFYQTLPLSTPYDRARRKTAKKPRPKQAEIDRSRQKTAKPPKTKPQFHRWFMRQMVSGIAVRNALILASNKMRIMRPISAVPVKPLNVQKDISFLYISLKNR